AGTFINNDLEYLRGGTSSQKYTTSVTKTKAADYRYIKWIEYLVPRTLWIQEPINYDKHALWGVSRQKCQQFYGFDVNWESALNASASESAFKEEPVQTISQIEEPSHPVFETAVQGSAQTWISELAKQANSRSFFNELLDTPIDFSNFIMNRLGVDTLTPELLAGPTYTLIRGSCNSLTELEYHLEEVYKATTDQMDWFNPEGQQYPHNLLQPLSLIPDN
nr:hypothetical protein [Tanacetum cinerariifolium]